jgi:CheY-like chemotaxis protein
MFSRGPQSNGLGIGLALSRSLATMHGGTLTASSAGPGQGAEFSLRLPMAEAPADEQGAPVPAAPMSALRILVADDNQDAGDTLEMLLTHLGAQVRVVRSGADALASFQGFDPDVVLLDIGMPGMDGYETARAIRASHAGHRAALVALTGWGQEQDRLRSRDAGFDHHLVKPADIVALQALLAQLAAAQATANR